MTAQDITVLMIIATSTMQPNTSSSGLTRVKLVQPTVIRCLGLIIWIVYATQDTRVLVAAHVSSAKQARSKQLLEVRRARTVRLGMSPMGNTPLA